jgi:hypothetical protein
MIGKVWQKEQEAVHEERRLEEMKKEIQEERKLQELQMQAAEAGHIDKVERLEFMYKVGLCGVCGFACEGCFCGGRVRVAFAGSPVGAGCFCGFSSRGGSGLESRPVSTGRGSRLVSTLE